MLCGKFMDFSDILIKIKNNALSQSNEQCRENYFNSCIKHGGEVAKVTRQVRNEINNQLLLEL
jgi:hypothetical protein